MKKILSILILVCVCFAVQAQTRPAAVTTTTYGNALDTVTNTGTKVTTAYQVARFNTGVTAQVIVTKISGTVGGSIGLYGSMDGTNFTIIGSAATATDASNTYSFNTVVGWRYYRISYAGTGTMSASVRSYIYPY